MTNHLLRRGALALLLVFTLISGASGQAAPSASAPRQAPAPWAATTTYNGIAYFAFGVPRRIERFRLSDATWLAPIALPRSYILVENPPSALAIDADGIYMAFGQAIYRMALDGTGATALINVGSTVLGLHPIGPYLYVVYHAYPEGRVLSINKASGARVAEGAAIYNLLVGTDVAPGRMRIYGRTSGISPSDIALVQLGANGAVGGASESPYHGDYPGGTQVFVFPDESRVADSSGVVYNAGNLTYSGGFGGEVTDLAFYHDLPVVLRGASLIAFTANLLETGRHTLSAGAQAIALGGTTIHAFRSGGERGVLVESVPLSSLGPLDPGAPINPLGLRYTPDRTILSEDGIIYLLSRSNRSIFRWSIAERRYLTSIPLAEAPDYITYAEPTRRLYLSYPGGKITQIKIDEGFTELPMVNAPATACGIAAADQYLFVCSPTGAWGTHIIYGPDGALIASRDWNYFSYDFVWSQANRRMYFLRDGISPNDLHSEQIGTDGRLGTMSETPYHDGAGMDHPIRVSPDGAVVILGSGRVFDAIALTSANNLSNTISDAAWGSSLFTLRPFSGGSQIQRWSAGFTLAATKDLPGTPLRLLHTSAGLLTIISRSGVPQFTLWDTALNPIFTSPTDSALRGLTVTANTSTVLGSPTMFQATVGDGTPVTYRWNFGDGATAEGANQSHTYASTGTFTVTVTASNAVSELSTTVSVTITDPPIPVLSVSPPALSFTAYTGEQPPPAKLVIITHNSSADLDWLATADQPWITLDPSGASSPGTLAVTVNQAGLEPGHYSGSVTISSNNAAIITKTVAVSLTVADPPPPALVVAPPSLTFNAVTGGALPGAQALLISHTGPAELGWSAATDRPWIELSAAGGTGAATMMVAVDQAGLEPGTYSGLITITLASAASVPASVPVTMVVSAEEPPPTLTVLPQELTFQRVIGGPAPAPQSLVVSHSGPPTLTWSAAADQPWLRLSRSSGLAPATIIVQAAGADLPAGVYTGTITIQLADLRAAAQQVVVRLIVASDDEAPIRLWARPAYRGIQLDWSPAHGTAITAYRVRRGPVGAPLNTLATTPETLYLDTDPILEPGATYCYQVEALKANGSVVASSGRACAVFGQVGLWVPDVWGVPGSLAVIPVNTHNVSGLQIAAADIWLDLDGRVLEPVGVSATPLSAGYTWSYGVSGSGASTRVRIAALTDTLTPLVGDGSLFWLIVRVRGAAGSSSPLNLQEYVAGIGGSTIYALDDLSTPVPLFLTDATFQVAAAYTLGDLNGNGTVEAVDAYIALQIAAGRLSPTPPQAAAGDVNGDGRVDPSDATLILFYAAHGTWPFLSEATRAARPAQAALPAQQIKLSLGATSGSPGSHVTVSLSANLVTGLAGGRFVLAYDPALVERIDGVQAEGAFSVQHHDDGEGLLTIAIADDAAHTVVGTLLTIRLTLSPSANAGTSAALSLAGARLNDALGRDFATSALGATIERFGSSLRVIAPSTTARIYLPVVRR